MINDYIWPYYIYVYFDILQKLNIDLKKLNSIDGGHDGNKKRELLYCNIIENITKLIPYSIKDGKEKLNNQGILELINDKLPYVKKELEEMLKKKKVEFTHIKNIRNNTEHSPHRLMVCSQFGTKGSSNIVMNYLKANSSLDDLSNGDSIQYCYCDNKILEGIVLDLNSLFRKIRKDIYKLIKDNKIDSKLFETYAKYKLKNKF